MRSNVLLLTALAVGIAACGASSRDGGDGGGGGGGGGTGGGGGGGMGTGGDMALPPGTTMKRFITSHYKIPAGQEFYQCEQTTVPSDTYIVKVIPVSPVGVHHEVMAIDPSNHADGTYGCGPIGLNWTPLFASGVGSPSLDMPPNVALKVSNGQHVVLNLHLFNATLQTLEGDAAIDVVLADDPTGYQFAGVPFAGNVTFTVPPFPYQVNGQCTVSNDTSYFAVFPHMHKTGAHMKVWTESAMGGTTVVWDQDYSFNEQKFGEYPNWQGPAKVDLKKGDKIKLTCTYDASGLGKQFGESTTDEMCFAISYVVPAIQTTIGSPFCIN